MKPLAVIALGFLIILIDIRYGTFDVLLDIIGWLVCFWGLLTMTRLGSWFGIGLAGAALGAGGAIFGMSAEPVGTLQVIDVVAMTMLLFGICSGLMQIAQPTDPETAKMAAAVRWALLAVAGLLIPIVVFSAGDSWLMAWTLLALAVVTWLLLLMFTRSTRPYADPFQQ